MHLKEVEINNHAAVQMWLSLLTCALESLWVESWSQFPTLTPWMLWSANNKKDFEWSFCDGSRTCVVVETESDVSDHLEGKNIIGWFRWFVKFEIVMTLLSWRLSLIYLEKKIMLNLPPIIVVYVDHPIIIDPFYQ